VADHCPELLEDEPDDVVATVVLVPLERAATTPPNPRKASADITPTARRARRAG
jgi:hypothetical protein